MTTWGITATAKTSREKLLAFIAHHQDLGAQQIWLYFDDPKDEAFDDIAKLAGVTATLCTDDYWQGLGRPRPETHQLRQVRNALRSYRRSKCDWIAHIDVDEFILCEGDVAAELSALPAEDIMTRMRPYEAMHDPTLPDDIYSARHFRRAFSDEEHRRAKRFMGDSADILPSGMLSHMAGKAFYRKGIAGLTPRIHGAFIQGKRLPCPHFNPAFQLLHFHAQDRQAWLASLPFRLTKGAYQFNPKLQAFLQNASPEEIATFYDQTQILKKGLRTNKQVIEADLHLRAKVARMQALTSPRPERVAPDASAP